MRKLWDKKGKKRAAAAVCLLAAGLAGGTLAYLTDFDQKINTFTIGKVDISLDEPSWEEPDDGVWKQPGDTTVKDPVVTALDGDSYMRVKVEILDGTGEKITDPVRLEKIKFLLRYDSEGSALQEGKAYSGEEIKELPMVNPAFRADLNAAGADGGTLYFNFTGDDGIFSKGETAAIFNRIAVPKDFDNEDLAVLEGDSYTTDGLGNILVTEKGNGFQLKLTAQAVQSENVSDQDAAWSLLDAEQTKRMDRQN